MKRAVSGSVMKGASGFRIAGCNESGPGPLFGSSDSSALLTSVEVITNGGIGWVLVFRAGVGVPWSGRNTSLKGLANIFACDSGFHLICGFHDK